ncbi:hypothetical protein [Natranaerofaba carboxydovora]|uniref:hypothetical protein n=1 Tax=Natranaerofaba carboxydovora TaxID=2742683 RepID=UPI001F12F19D|nr:hypothetical protein [Natranaerofaba carboxydovora]
MGRRRRGDNCRDVGSSRPVPLFPNTKVKPPAYSFLQEVLLLQEKTKTHRIYYNSISSISISSNTEAGYCDELKRTKSEGGYKYVQNNP